MRGPPPITRIVAGTVIGSMATGHGGRWSDLDLSFAVGEGFPLGPVLEDWTAKLVAEFSAGKLFDLPAGPSIYRVLLLPGCLQFDLSLTPAPDRRKEKLEAHLALAREQVQKMNAQAAEEDKRASRQVAAQRRAARQRKSRLESAVREVERLQRTR